MLCTLPSAAAASPFARYVQEASQDPRASTAPTAVIAAEPISVPVTPVAETAVERTRVVAKVDEPAAADEPEAAKDRPWEVGGFIDANYSFNSNLPDNHVNRVRTAVPRTGEFSMNLAVAYVRRDAVPGELSPTFELALQAGPAADALTYYEPTPGGEASRFAGSEVFKHIARANVGLKTRRGTELGVGMHLAPIGLGTHWTPFNWNYSASYEADGVPYYFGGLKVVHTINERHGLQLWVVNGWQTLTDANKVPSVMLGYTFTASPRFNVATYAYAGPDQADVRPAAWRLYSDNQFTYNSERFGIGALADIGAERLTDQPGQPMALWMTGAVFTRWRVLGKQRTWDMGARPEAYWDRDGRIYGVAKNLLVAGTYTNQVRLTENLLIRLEYRYDHAARPQGYFYRGAAIADDAPSFARHQHTVYLAVAGTFAYRFGKPRG